MEVEWGRLRAFIEDQDGVIARWQAELCGMTKAGFASRLSGGEWQAVLPGVYRPAGYPLRAEARLRAAALWAGPGAVVGGAAAAWWWGMTDSDPPDIEMIIAPRRNLRSRPGFPVVRRVLPAEDHTTHRQVRVLAPPLAALLGAVALGAKGQQVLDRALLRLVRLPDAQAALERNTGARGATQARRWLTAAADGTAAESERMFAKLLRKADIRGWQVNRVRRFPGGPLMPDFRFDRHRVIVEIDGWAFHSDPQAFDGDRARQNRMSIGGWSVLRFTWFQLQERPEWVIDQTISMLAAAGAQTR